MTPAKGPLVGMLVFALLGCAFAAASTFDFIAHLDRQVHPITCSWMPGVGAADASGSSGCHAVMMSPYSSVFRTSTWGGVPIALPALAVFAFLLVRALLLLLQGGSAAEQRFVLAAWALPVLVSIVYFGISTVLIGAVCKLCIGIYVASLGGFACAWLARRSAGAAGAIDWPSALRGFAEGAAYVLIPVVIYLALKPAYATVPSSCGALSNPEDRSGVSLVLSDPATGVPAIELLDPLCPACRAMSQRLHAGGYTDRLALRAVLFPLDKDCNWMVKESVHPGACTAAEAALCAGNDAPAVLDWIFRHQSELTGLGQQSGSKVAARIAQQFPKLGGCIGKPEVRAKLNRSLRWAVQNSLPVLTPQLFVRGQKVCDEDTDLGLDYVLERRLEGRR